MDVGTGTLANTPTRVRSRHTLDGLAPEPIVQVEPRGRAIALPNGAPEISKRPMHATGAFLSEAAKSIWAEDTDGNCPLQLPVPTVHFAAWDVPGEQTINRAELCGVIQAIRAARYQGFDAIEIWTDSQYVINTWNNCSGSMAASNPDLVRILHNLRADSIQLRKVKSHTDLRQLWGMEQWLSLGNAVVDTAARAAVQDDLPLVCDLMDRTVHHEAQQLADLRFFWRFLQDLSKEEYRLLRCRSSTSASDEEWKSRPLYNAQTYQLPGSASMQALFNADSYQTRSGRCHTGTAYVELLVAFIVSTGVSPPDSLEAAAEVPEPPLQWMRPCTVRQWVCNLVEAVRQLERLAHVNLWGPRRHKVFALRSLGVKEARHGLAQRPKFVQEEIVFDLLYSTVQRNDLEPLRVFLRQYTGVDKLEPGQWRRDVAFAGACPPLFSRGKV
ncbi:unnamed protein product [Symbiodinium microadriaticum]|nr:unnamed protein product [Symbiodinium microadriaticum]CAE7948936.1 unnamed protein product [Symbiodinium sp. KB8]